MAIYDPWSSMTQVAFGHFTPGLRGGLRVGQVPGDAGRQGGGQTLRTDRVEAKPGEVNGAGLGWAGCWRDLGPTEVINQ